MHLTLKTWPLGDLLSTLTVVALVALVESLFFAHVIAPSSVLAGCSLAIAARYLHQLGYSLHHGTMRRRLKVLGVFLVVVVLSGSLGVVIFGR